MATINFAIDNPLTTLEQESGLGPAAGTVTGGPGGSIANNTITSSNLAPGAAAGNLTANSVPGTVIQNNTITSTQLAPGAAVGNITPNSIPGTDIVNNSITSTQLAPGAAVGNITPNSIPGADIVNNSITSTQLAPGAAVGNITANSIPGADIVNNSITSAQLAPGAAVGNLTANSVPGADIVDASITDAKLAPGAVNTVKGTNSNGNVDDFILGPTLALTLGAGPTLSVANAGNTQFGAIEFDPTGDLQDSGSNTGIAKLKQPQNAIAGFPAVVSLGFDSMGRFISTPPVFSSNFAQTRGTPLTVGNLQFQVPAAGRVSLQMKFTVSAGTGVDLNGQWMNQAPVGVAGTDFKTTFSNLTTATLQNFTYLSTDNTWDATNGVFTEIYYLYVNETPNDAVYRVTVQFFNPDAIVVERLSA